MSSLITCRKIVGFGVALGITFGNEGEHMIRMLLTVAVLGSLGSFAAPAAAQGKQGEASGSDVSSLQAKLEAQCAHRRRTMPPDARDDCDSKLRSLRREAQIGSGQVGAAAGNAGEASEAGPGNGGGQGNGNGLGNGQGNGIGGGQGNGIGPGSGGGKGGGRR